MNSNKFGHTRDMLENCYYYFIETLSTMSKTPPEQSAKMGDYNVAYELRDDGLAVEDLIEQNIIEFTPDQIEGMKKLLSALNALSDDALKGGSTREENLRGLSDPGWQLVRETAKELMLLLAARTLENRRYLNITENPPRDF